MSNQFWTIIYGLHITSGHLLLDEWKQFLYWQYIAYVIHKSWFCNVAYIVGGESRPGHVLHNHVTTNGEIEVALKATLDHGHQGGCKCTPSPSRTLLLCFYHIDTLASYEINKGTLPLPISVCLTPFQGRIPLWTPLHSHLATPCTSTSPSLLGWSGGSRRWDS